MSNNLVTYNALIKGLERFCHGHFILRRFSHGQIDVADIKQDGEYPFMHVVPVQFDIVQGAWDYTLQVFFADLPRDKEEKPEYQREVISDLTQCAADLVYEISTSQVLFGPDVFLTDGFQPVITPFMEEYTHVLTGVTLDIQIRVFNTWDGCAIPADYAAGGSGTNSPAYAGLTFEKSIVNNLGIVTLVNDVTSPGNSYYYGTNASGTKGWFPLPTGSGTVTSVGLSMPSAFLVANSPVTGAGTLTVTGAGTSGQYIDGTGALQTFPTLPTGTVESVTGLNTDNTDPANPVVQISVDGTTITGDGTPGNPLVASATGTVESVTGDSVDNTDPANPVVNAIPLAGTAVGSPVTDTIEFRDTVGGDYPLVLFRQADTDAGVTVEIVRDENSAFFYRQFNVSVDTGVQIVFDTASIRVERYTPSTGIVDWSYVFDNNEDGQSASKIINLKKRFWTKAGTPDANDDDLDGFIVGSLLWDTTNSILYRATSVTAGAATWAVVPTGGTVTSVALSAPSEFTVSGSPVTTSGTLTFTKANQNANLVYAGPTTGAAAAPTFRSLVVADIPSSIPRQDSAIQTGNFGGNTVGAGTTTYAPYFGSQANFNATESTRQIPTPIAGTISQFYVRISTAQPGTGSLVFTIRKNGAATALTITIPAGSAAGVYSDTVNSFTVVAGDLLSIEVVNNASGASGACIGFSTLFTR